MKKNPMKKLTLTKETVRNLHSASLEGVVVGGQSWWDFGTWNACTRRRGMLCRELDSDDLVSHLP